jgi:uncharacterized protein (TIGR03663 family)
MVYVAAAAMLLRFYALPLKPLHHDEGVNTLLLVNLVRPPHVYQYDPINYHGPSLYYLTWLSVLTFGLTTFAIRFVTALAGLAAVLSIAGLRRQLGSVGSCAAALLLAVSPGAVYFSRYFIHEMLLACFTLVAAIAAAAYVWKPRAWVLSIAAVSAGLMFATKETAILSVIAMVAAAFGTELLYAAREVRALASPRKLTVGELSRATWARAMASAAQHARLVTFRSVAYAALLFLGVNLLLYTSLFTLWRPALDALTSFASWTGTGTSAHIHPWRVYLQWLATEETALAIVGGAGALLALWRSDNRLAIFASLWTIAVISGYSLIPYKTPWLTLNMTAPLALCGGYAAQLAWQVRRRLPRVLLPATAILVVAGAGVQAVRLNFAEYDNETLPYVYAHTSREVLTMVEEIGRLESEHPGSAIAVTSADHFPLSWYLRGYPVGFYGRVLATGDPLVIASEDQQEELEALLGDQYSRVASYRLRPGVTLVLYVRRDLRRGARDVVLLAAPTRGRRADAL